MSNGYENWKLSDVIKKSREELVDYLVWYDENGIWSDGDTKAEGIPKTSLSAARDEVFHAIVVGIKPPKIGDPVSFDQLVAAHVSSAADEITVDFKNGTHPKSTDSFSKLHDHVDANLYGGASFLLSLYGGESNLQDAVDVVNMGSKILDIWLKNGRTHRF